MNTELIKGNIWKFGDNVDTDEIIPTRYLAHPKPEEWARHAMEPIFPGFASKIRKGDIIVGGKNFGCGSSREHAPIALKVAGIGAIVADSIARIFFRNAINNGLLALECSGISDKVEQGNELEIDLIDGTIRDTVTRNVFHFIPLPEFLIEIVRKGGLAAYLSGN